jgi:hypothetical protein
MLSPAVQTILYKHSAAGIIAIIILAWRSEGGCKRMPVGANGYRNGASTLSLTSIMIYRSAPKADLPSQVPHYVEFCGSRPSTIDTILALMQPNTMIRCSNKYHVNGTYNLGPPRITQVGLACQQNRNLDPGRGGYEEPRKLLYRSKPAVDALRKFHA